MTERTRGSVFCLPFAGGGAYSYRDFRRHAGRGARIVALDLPGRGRRFAEPLLGSLPDMAEDTFAQLRDRLDPPYAIFGHSLGAWVGYLLVKRILRERLPRPARLFVSGRGGPSVPGGEAGRHRLPREAFLEVVRRFAGTTQDVLANREVMDLFEPVLRADFRALDTYVHARSEPVDVPITVLRGSEDSVSRADALRWQEETTQPIVYRECPGGHFFIFPHAASIVQMLFETLETAADPAASPPPR